MGCSSTPTRTSASSRGSGGRRWRSCRSCSTTTCATPSRSTSRSARWRRAGCTHAAATGPTVRFLDASEQDPLDVADDEVDRLLDGGWDPKHVALLTTGHRHPIQVERTDFHDQDGYWRTYWDDDVFYGHVLGCKGLERRAVVLCLNEDGSRDRARERLYVGMSRATDELVVVGDPETVRRVAGDDVARRLGLS